MHQQVMAAKTGKLSTTALELLPRSDERGVRPVMSDTAEVGGGRGLMGAGELDMSRYVLSGTRLSAPIQRQMNASCTRSDSGALALAKRWGNRGGAAVAQGQGVVTGASDVDLNEASAVEDLDDASAGKQC